MRELSGSSRALSVLLLGVIAAVSMSTLALIAQEPEPGTEFGEIMDVEVIDVDVRVSDGKGRPIIGLEASDFELYVDGRPVEITNFRAVAGPATASPSSRPLDVPAEPPIALPSIDEEQLHVVILFDNLHLEPAGRKRVIEQIGGFIEEQTAAGHRIMLLAHHQGTDVLRSFTTDAVVLETDLAALATSTPAGLFRRREWRSLFDDVKDAFFICTAGPNSGPGAADGDPCAICQSELIAVGRRYAQLSRASRLRVEGSLANVIALLARVPGRKAVLLVTDGFALRPGADAFHYLSEVCPQNAGAFLSEVNREAGIPELQRLTERANANRITLYALEAKGLEGDSRVSVDFGDLRFSPSSLNDQIRRSNTQGSLFFLAEQTGGKAILNANQPGPELLKLSEDLDHYYSLGYFSDHTASEGHSHRVGVQLRKKKNLDLRYRRAFRHKPLEEILGELTLGAFMLGMEDNPLDAMITAGEPRPRDDGRWIVPVDVAIPSERLESLPGGLEEGRLVVVVVAPDSAAKNNLAVRKKDIVALSRPGDSHHRVGVEIPLDPGEHLLAFGIRDRLAGKTSYLRLELHVAEPAAAP